MNEKWANKANENLYSYYMEHPLEFREKHVAIQTILVDYAEENKLLLHPDWFDYPENIIKYNTPFLGCQFSSILSTSYTLLHTTLSAHKRYVPVSAVKED